MQVGLPNLIIPGAPKAGTSSICEYLSQHPDVYVPAIKEPRFFIGDKIRQLPDCDPIKNYLVSNSFLSEIEYRSLYKAKSAKVSVDASVQYLYYYEYVIPKIKAMLGEPSIIICLRNPVERAFSNFMYTASPGVSFEDEIQKENEKIVKGINSFYLYVGQGYYYEQVKAYLAAFPKIKIVLFEDIKASSNKLMLDIFDFLSLSSIEINTKTVHNQSGRPRNRLINYFVFQNNPVKQILRPMVKNFFDAGTVQKLVLKLRSISRVKRSDDVIAPETRNLLVSLYREDIFRLQDLINRDLSSWVKFN